MKEMLEAEMDDHLGYERSERSDNDDYRNGYKSKTVNSSYGSMRIDVPDKILPPRLKTGRVVLWTRFTRFCISMRSTIP